MGLKLSRLTARHRGYIIGEKSDKGQDTALRVEKYEVVVIGSGIGGLGAAALLAHSGYKTLVVEKLANIAGRLATYEYEGFRIPGGAIAIHYHGTEIEEIFNEVGVRTELVKVPRLYYRIGGTDHEMPAKGSLSAGLDIISKLEEDRVRLAGGFVRAVGRDKIMAAFRRGARGNEKESNLTLKDWLLQYTENDLAHRIFDTIANTLCAAHSYEISAGAVFTFFTKMDGFRDVSVSPRGNLENMEKLADVVRANGEVWLNSPAVKINTSGKTARSVIVSRDGGEVEVSARVVISNIGPRMTVRLTGENVFGEDYLREMRLKLRPHPVTMCYVASDRPLWPENGEAAILMIVGARRLTGIIPLSSISPEFAPPGQHLLFAFGGPPSNEVHLEPEVEAEQILQDLKEQFPRFEKHGRVLRMIFKDIDDELPEMRTRVGLGMPVTTPVKNLFNVGDGCPAPGYSGSNAAAESAKRVVQKVKESYQPGKA
jgi:phytoene dehydrogenase-like protein